MARKSTLDSLLLISAAGVGAYLLYKHTKQSATTTATQSLESLLGAQGFYPLPGGGILQETGIGVPVISSGPAGQGQKYV